MTRWCNNLSLAGKRPVRIKLPLTQIQYLREVPGFRSAGHIYLVLAERKGRGGDGDDQLLLVIFALASEHFHINVTCAFCLSVLFEG